MNWRVNAVLASGWTFVGAVGFLTERWGTAWTATLLALGFAFASWSGRQQQRREASPKADADDKEA